MFTKIYESLMYMVLSNESGTMHAGLKAGRAGGGLAVSHRIEEPDADFCLLISGP